NGINFISGLELIVRNSRIMYFATNGMNVASNTSGARVVIQNCLIAFNGTQGTANSGGVTIQGNGVGNQAFIMDTMLENNKNYGVQVTGGSNIAAFLRSTVAPTGIVSVNSGQLASIGPSNFFGSVTGTLSPANFQ